MDGGGEGRDKVGKENMIFSIGRGLTRAVVYGDDDDDDDDDNNNMCILGSRRRRAHNCHDGGRYRYGMFGDPFLFPNHE